ncbi:MAG: inositol monophosphatase [Flavobacteriales bacterium]|nr:inositol monophosphatase [Flavobacteriales bacterium]
MISPLLLNQIRHIAIETGAYIKQEAISFHTSAIENKGLHDLVSYVDKTAEKRIVESLDLLMPNASFINEESGNIQRQAEYTWIIDPLDGTTNFIHGIPHYCISIALMYQSQIIMGVVHDVATGDLFSAQAGKGSFLNGQAIHVSSRDNLSESLIATGFPVNNFSRIEPTLSVLEQLILNTRGVRRIGTAALDLSYVACGRFDAYYEHGLYPWDVAAGSLIVQEAGGHVSDFSGANQYLFGKEIVAAAPGVYDTILQLLRTYYR